MWHEKIQEGFDVFLKDGGHSFGAVRQVRKDEIVVYIENGGDFTIPMSAVREVEAEKVVLDGTWLDPKLREAIRRAHSGEDPRIP
jgi:hypothetical protein